MSVSVFVQLSSNGRTGIFSMVISWKFAQGPGAQFAFFLLGHHFRLRLTLRTFFFLHGSLLEPGREPVDDQRRLDDKFTNYIEGSRKSSTGACSKRGWGVTHAYSGQIMGSNDKRRTWTVPARVETDLRRCSGNPMPPCPQEHTDPEPAYRGRKQQRKARLAEVIKKGGNIRWCLGFVTQSPFHLTLFFFSCLSFPFFLFVCLFRSARNAMRLVRFAVVHQPDSIRCLVQL